MRGREDKRKIEIEALPHDKKPTEVPASVGFIHLVYERPPAGYSLFCGGHTPSPLRGTPPILGGEFSYSVRKAYAKASASKTFLIPPLK